MVDISELMSITTVTLCCLLLVVCGQGVENKANRTFPPRVIRHPPKEVAYKVGDSVGGRVELPCVATATPPPSEPQSYPKYATIDNSPGAYGEDGIYKWQGQEDMTYSWQKDGLPLKITGTDIKKDPGTGTLIIEEPLDRHEGIYQCFAKNELGTALSLRSVLRQAILEPFDTVTEAKVHTPEIGSSLVLRCTPPRSYPTGTVYWGESTPNNKFRPLQMSDRVSQDYEGNLWIANVKQQDHIGGMKYLCNVANNVIRSLVQGEDQRVDPYGASATPKFRAPKLMWNSETPTTAIVGTMKTLKCIFSGYPTPEVTWKRIDKPMLEKNYETSFGHELTLPNVEYEDEGTYQCSATNMPNQPPVTKNFVLHVESLPEWVRNPEDVRSAEEENAEFHCEASGSPPPQIQWTINGRRVEELPSDPRRVVTDTSIFYTNLTKTDAQVLQCNASNKHGYIFSNAYLNVAAEAPSWEKVPESKKVAENQDVTISCRVFGAPKPKIVWSYSEEKENAENRQKVEIADQDQEQLKHRFTVLKNGDLSIVSVLQEDAGYYECQASNKFGMIALEGHLVVRESTRIIKSPESSLLNASDTLILECDATTDPNERGSLTIEWKFRGEFIDYKQDKRITKNKDDNSLKITGVKVEDTGEYVCVADNGLDSEEISATITVQDKPDPPRNLRLSSCGANTADVVWDWDESNDNNNEVIEFIVYYNTSFDEPGQFHKAKAVPRGTTTARIQLSPWGNYTFHVVARNNLGTSDRSNFTPAFCTTPPDIPYRNPRGVCVDLRDPTLLVIVWEPMPQVEHNGEDFYYRVGYQEAGIQGAEKHVENVYDWRQKEFVVRNVQMFTRYEIFVQAANVMGTSPDSKLRHFHGHSGEGSPLDAPEGFAVYNDSVNATSAIFNWNAVDEDPSRIRGHFKGYKVKFWKTDDPDNVRDHEVIVKQINKCPVIRHRRNRRQAKEIVEGHVLNLWPFSSITAGVLVLNSGKEGDLSSTIQFNTPEGVPSIVPMFEVREVGSHHFGLAWAPPLEANGIITGYIIAYEKADSTIGPIEESDPVGPMQRSMKLKKLEPSTRYRLYIWAATKQGKGVVQTAEETTKEAGFPDKPGFATVDFNQDSVNVSWVPTEDGPSNNPGSEFYVEYKKKGSDDPPIRAYPDGDNNWLNVSGLDTGAEYEFVVVAVNGDGDETRSDPKDIRLGPKEAPIEQGIAKAGWFVVMMCAIAFLLLILIIVCIIKRNRGGKYPVHEKEKLRGRDPDKDDDEGGFGEYTKTDEPDYKKSAGSLESETKPLGESDTDSMAEYGDMDAGKFNEDGSFIGQYGGKKKPEEKMEPDATSPNALSTFV